MLLWLLRPNTMAAPQPGPGETERVGTGGDAGTGDHAKAPGLAGTLGTTGEPDLATWGFIRGPLTWWCTWTGDMAREEDRPRAKASGALMTAAPGLSDRGLTAACQGAATPPLPGKAGWRSCAGEVPRMAPPGGSIWPARVLGSHMPPGEAARSGPGEPARVWLS